MSWYHSDDIITETDRISNISSVSQTLEGKLLIVNMLTITDLRVTDNGAYLCQVSNRYGNHMSIIGQVTVQGN